MSCRCGLDCRTALRAELASLDPATARLLTTGRLEQRCECGKVEIAAGMCSGCGHRPAASTWHRSTQTPRGAVAAVLHAEDRPSVTLEADR